MAKEDKVAAPEKKEVKKEKKDKKETKPKVEQPKAEKKDEKKVAKKETKKDVKPTSAPKTTKKADPKKDAKKGDRKQKPMSPRAALKQMMRKDPKMRAEIAKGTKGLPKARAHAKKLKLMRKNRFIKFVVDCHKLFKDRILKPRSLVCN